MFTLTTIIGLAVSYCMFNDDYKYEVADEGTGYVIYAVSFKDKDLGLMTVVTAEASPDWKSDTEETILDLQKQATSYSTIQFGDLSFVKYKYRQNSLFSDGVTIRGKDRFVVINVLNTDNSLKPVIDKGMSVSLKSK